jgi:Lon protease-like protein
MFPLGAVLYPYMLLPLHVFEPRYRALTKDCLAGDRCFGIVLIERGEEVGGRDRRFSLGTIAHIQQAQPLDDGRWILLTTGAQRIRVLRWLPEHPYPRAEVEEIEDPPLRAEAERLVQETLRVLRRVNVLRYELGLDDSPFMGQLSSDPIRASYEAATIARLGPLDAQRLLEMPSAESRLEALSAFLGEEAAALEQRLADGLG